ncbi:hypothetical protein DH2020_038078 [Rehmannia glutinosa]|uniref:Ataxin-10 domain-containing protein n=1 Tax=Rehmannia glutinosa TaxID=99300 RepID=A0ABR0V0U8_REHGL
MSMDDTKSHNFSLPDSGLEPLFAASRTSTLNKALERLIETAKTSDGRLDLASKHILSPVLQLCQYPLQLSGQDLFLSIKLVRNLCAGEIKNQNLFIEQNGVGILSTLVTSVRLTCSDNRILPMVLQVLGNVSLAGEQHRLVEKLPLPTGSADIDVIGYTLSILRDICACDPKFSNQDEKEDVVDKLVSAGLIKFFIGLLRDLEPPAMIRKATINSDAKNEATLQFSKYCPYRGFRRDVVAVIGNCSYRKKHVQDEIREQDGILLLLQQCVTDEDNPFLREWGFWSMRNILEGNAENQQLVTDLELQKSVDTPEIAGLGLRVEVDPKTRRPKLVNL